VNPPRGIRTGLTYQTPSKAPSVRAEKFMSGTGKVLIAFLLSSLMVHAASINYYWQFIPKKGNLLVIYLPEEICNLLEEKSIFLFLLSNGKVYKKTLKKKPRYCKLYKLFRKKPTKMKVLIFQPKDLEIISLGIFKAP